MKYRLLILLMLLAAVPAFAQTRSQLEQKKKKLNSEMQTTSKMINETQRSRRGTENKLILTQQSIRQGNEYIGLLNSEIDILNRDLDSIQATKSQNLDRLDFLRREYAINVKLLYQQSRRNGFSTLLFIVAAKDFNEGFRRFRYLQQLSARRRAKAAEIQAVTDSLQAQETQITDNRQQKEHAVSERETQQRRLEQQKKSQNQQLAKLKKKEAELKQKQKNQQAQINKLQAKIQEVINAEIAAAQRKKAASQGSKSTTTTPATKYAMSREEQLVAGNFEANRGKLPRPIERGNLTGHFGVQPHPYLDKVTINNKGVYFQSPAGSNARCVFEGVVTKVFTIAGSNQSVIIRHGNYSTVYSNLSTVFVKSGDKVTARQNIGRIFTDPENGNKTELYFLLYRDRDILNPEQWLAN